MTSGRARPGNNFLWCLRHFAWVMLVCGLLGAAAALLVAPSSPTYQADTLVVTHQLVASPKSLPSLADGLFADGAVAASLSHDPAVGKNTTGLIPDRVSVVVAQDSITMDVQARDTDPATAKRLADLAAKAFVVELNRPGAGVGQFAVQAPAVVPTTPLQQFSEPIRGILGGAVGLVIGFGLIALISVIRRPVVTAADVEEATGAPLLGTVELRRVPRGGYLGPRGVRGIAAVTRTLAALPRGRLALISPRSAEGARRRIFVMLALTLSTVRKVRLEAPEELLQAARRSAHDHPSALLVRQDTGDELVLADSGSALDIVDPRMTGASIAAIAPRGMPRRRLRALAADYVDGGLIGIILVRGRGGFRSAPAPVAAPRPADDVATRPTDIPTPERA